MLRAYLALAELGLAESCMVKNGVFNTLHTVLKAARYGSLFAAVAAISLSLPSHGADSAASNDRLTHFLDFFNPYASLSYAYDSNVLRLDDITPLPDGRADQYGTLALGFDSTLERGGQKFDVNGEFNSRRYNIYDQYDYQGGRALAIWHWAASQAWTGTAGYKYLRTLRDFANEISPKRTLNLRNENRIFASADDAMSDHWKLGVRGDAADIRYTSTKTLDLKRTSGGTALTYISKAENELGLDFNVINGNYTQGEAADFTEYAIGPLLKWKYTVRTQLDAQAGYTQRQNRGRNPSTFGAATGKLTLTIADAGRGSFKASMYREFSNLGDEIADYTVVDGVYLEPGWTLSNGISFRLHGSYEHRDFRTSRGSTGRLDDVGTVSGFMDWPIGNHIKITAGLTTERRSSNLLYQDYEYLEQQIEIVGTL